MFKPKSGRKVDNAVWAYFMYDVSSDKSRCIANISKDSDDTQTHECGQLLSGKNATNLRNHLRFKHKKAYEALLQTERQRATVKDARPLHQKQLHVQVSLLLYIGADALVSYADNVLLIAASWGGLQRLMSVLCKHAAVINMSFN